MNVPDTFNGIKKFERLRTQNATITKTLFHIIHKAEKKIS